MNEPVLDMFSRFAFIMLAASLVLGCGDVVEARLTFELLSGDPGDLAPSTHARIDALHLDVVGVEFVRRDGSSEWVGIDSAIDLAAGDQRVARIPPGAYATVRVHPAPQSAVAARCLGDRSLYYTTHEGTARVDCATEVCGSATLLDHAPTAATLDDLEIISTGPVTIPTADAADEGQQFILAFDASFAVPCGPTLTIEELPLFVFSAPNDSKGHDAETYAISEHVTSLFTTSIDPLHVATATFVFDDDSAVVAAHGRVGTESIDLAGAFDGFVRTEQDYSFFNGAPVTAAGEGPRVIRDRRLARFVRTPPMAPVFETFLMDGPECGTDVGRDCLGGHKTLWWRRLLRP